MSESSHKRAVIVGLFVVLGLTFLFGGILMVGNLHETFKKKVEVVAFFDDVNGLQSGNNVWFSGVKVGNVHNLHFQKKSNVKVTIRIEIKAQEYIRKNAKVKISTDGLIGNKILVIYGGTARYAEIEAGDTLEVEKAFSQEDMMNTLQESNKNLQSITSDLKTISKKMVAGEGTIGKLLNDNTLYNNATAATVSLQRASQKGQELFSTLNSFSTKLNQEGALANDLVTDTVVFESIREIAQQLKVITDTAAVFITQLKATVNDSTTSMGVMLHNKEEGDRMKVIIKNLESSSIKLDQDLEALQHSFLLKKGIRKMDKENKKDSTTNQK